MGTYRRTKQSTSRRQRNVVTKRKRISPNSDAGNAAADNSQHDEHHTNNEPNAAGNFGYWAPLWGDECPPGERPGSWL